MDETRLDYTHKILDDHETRIRTLEQNDKLELRVEVLESYMKGEIEVCGNKKSDRSEVYTIIAMCISILTFIVLIWKTF